MPNNHIQRGPNFGKKIQGLLSTFSTPIPAKLYQLTTQEKRIVEQI